MFRVSLTLLLGLMLIGACKSSSNYDNAFYAYGPIPKLKSDYVIDRFAKWSDDSVCNAATFNANWATKEIYAPHVEEARKRGLDCGVGAVGLMQVKTPVAQPVASNAAFKNEQQKRIQLEQELAALKAQQQQHQQTISNDTIPRS